MTVFEVSVFKILGTEIWANVYHFDVADISTARTRANSVVNLERPVHSTAVTIQGTRTRQTGVGHVGVIDLSGLLGTTAPTGVPLPLFNCARVDFENGTRRPGRKYLRTGFGGGDLLAPFSWAAAVITKLNTYADGLLALAGICDPQGRPLVARSVISPVAMHQLKRGNRSPIPPP
jgi:hypothetical protein